MSKDKLFTMLQLEDSWIYQRGVKKGGIKVLQELALQTCRKRFGTDEVSAERIRRLEDADTLKALIDRLYTSPSLAEALADLPTG